MAIAGGEAQSQKMAYEKQSTLLGMAQQRKAAADEARKEATNQLVGGLTDMAGGAAGAVAASKGFEGMTAEGGNPGKKLFGILGI